MASTLQRVLELWRESERQLAAQPPGSREGAALTMQIERLRLLYQRITSHELGNISGFKVPDRTIVRAEWLTTRSRASASLAKDALNRSRSARDNEDAGSPSRPEEAVANHS